MPVAGEQRALAARQAELGAARPGELAAGAHHGDLAIATIDVDPRLRRAGRRGRERDLAAGERDVARRDHLEDGRPLRQRERQILGELDPRAGRDLEGGAAGDEPGRGAGADPDLAAGLERAGARRQRLPHRGARASSSARLPVTATVAPLGALGAAASTGGGTSTTAGASTTPASSSCVPSLPSTGLPETSSAGCALVSTRPVPSVSSIVEWPPCALIRTSLLGVEVHARRGRASASPLAIVIVPNSTVSSGRRGVPAEVDDGLLQHPDLRRADLELRLRAIRRACGVAAEVRSSRRGRLAILFRVGPRDRAGDDLVELGDRARVTATGAQRQAHPCEAHATCATRCF